MSEELDLDTGESRILEEDDDVPQKKKTMNHPNKEDILLPRIRRDGRTRFRLALSPYLPPPVIKGMAQLDAGLKPLVGPEASMTLGMTLVLGLMILQLLKVFASGGPSSTGKAIADDDDDANASAALTQQNADEYGTTVILCGPMSSGKTRVFYHLCHNDANMPTVMSLRANAALLSPKEEKDNDNRKPLRVLDYPGHSGLQDDLFLQMLQTCNKTKSSAGVRMVLVVDSTIPVTAAADVMYDLLQHASNLHTSSASKLDILVACHKSDLSSSKNPRRIKLTLRSELEKLIQVKATTLEDDTSVVPWWKDTPGDLDLDNLAHAQLQFEATTCSVGDGIDKIVDFCHDS